MEKETWVEQQVAVEEDKVAPLQLPIGEIEDKSFIVIPVCVINILYNS